MHTTIKVYTFFCTRQVRTLEPVTRSILYNAMAGVHTVWPLPSMIRNTCNGSALLYCDAPVAGPLLVDAIGAAGNGACCAAGSLCSGCIWTDTCGAASSASQRTEHSQHKHLGHASQDLARLPLGRHCMHPLHAASMHLLHAAVIPVT